MENATDYTVRYQNATILLPSENLNWTNWTDTLSTLAFNRSDYAAISSTVENIFQPQTSSYPVLCVYPISSQYGFLARLAYYLLLVFSLILRKHVWLSTAATGYAMTYGATTCVHAFALLVRYQYKQPDYSNLDFSLRTTLPSNYFGDLDMVPMLPILASGCVMLTPILTWSETVKKHHAQSVVVWWGVLMFTTLIPVALKNWKGVFPSFVLTQVATCDTSLAGCTLINQTEQGILISKDIYHRCHCSDTCSAASIPDSPFRQNSNVQVYTMTNQVAKLLDSNVISWYYVTNFIVLSLICGYGVLGLIAVKFTPAEVRNWMFRLLAGRMPKSERQTLKSKLKYYFAKLIAAGFFMTGIVVSLICPLVFASSIIVYEIHTWGYPPSEYFDAVGQWSVWISALFVIIAGIIQKYNHAWMESLVLGFRTSQRLIKWAQGKGTFRAEANKQERNKENSAVERTGAFFHQLARPFVHVAKSITTSWSRVVLEWDDYMHWCNDPVHASSLPPYHWRVYLPHRAEAGKISQGKGPHRLRDAAEVHYTSLPTNDPSTGRIQQQKPSSPAKNSTWSIPTVTTESHIVNESQWSDSLPPPHSRYSLLRPEVVERRATLPVEPMDPHPDFRSLPSTKVASGQR